MPSTAVMCCCSRVNAAGVEGVCDAGGVEGPATALFATAGAAGGASEPLGGEGALSPWGWTNELDNGDGPGSERELAGWGC